MSTRWPVLLLLPLLSAPVASGASEWQWQHPVIKEHGRVVSLPDAAMQIDSTLEYRLVFDVTKGAVEKQKANDDLDHVARFLNLMGLGSNPRPPAQIVAVVHGNATGIVLNDEAYRREFGHANPHLPLIRKLTGRDVRVYVCGQALAEHGFALSDVAKEVVVALAAQTVLANYQLQGFALMP